MAQFTGVKVFAPASVSNMGSGFDIIGFPIEEVGDTLKVTKNDASEIRITRITGYDDIPKESDRNVASYAASSLLQSLHSQQGFDMEIHKAVRPGSGLGSSASSSAAAVVAVNELMGNPYAGRELIDFAMEGESLVSGGRHADNVAPAIIGGIILVRSYGPLDIVRIPPPGNLWTVVLHPQIEIKTDMSRSLLMDRIDLKDAIRQWGNVGGLIAGFYTSNYDLIGDSMEDLVAEPYRSQLIPGYQALKNLAMANGAKGFTISGSGPSFFAICDSKSCAQNVEKMMQDAYKQYKVDFITYLSKVDKKGTVVLDKW
jgi:homoserine kinase